MAFYFVDINLMTIHLEKQTKDAIMKFP